MANLVPRWQTTIGLGKETTYATGVVPAVFWSIEQPKPADVYEELVDEGYRGLPGADQVFYQGVRESTYSMPNVLFYPDNAGHILMAMMGNDSITGGNPYTHAIAAATGLPPSYSITEYSGATAGGNARRFVGNYLSKLDLKWVDNGKFEYTANWRGRASATVANPAQSYSALNPFIPWQGALTLNGSSDNKMRELSLAIERLEPQNVFGSAGTQDPAYGFVGRLRVTGTAIFAVTDETELLLYINNTQGALSLLLTQSANVTLTIQMTKCAFTKGTVLERNKEYITVSAAFRAISNVTDSSSGGATAGPILFSLKNAVTPGY